VRDIPTKGELAARGIEEVAIEPGVNEYTHKPVFHVKGYGEYPDSSVLAGQPRRVHLDTFDTLEEAQAAYPFSSTEDGPRHVPDPVMPSSPPDWFDPLDAGESWDEV
jgi:hypothetical protein